ncbi:MAG TPA: hypothetical protein DCG49_12290 [Ruminococcus sp.]|nr:hypothetical protein [Ruminococcus sp.]
MNVNRIITAAFFLLLLTGCTADSAESSQSTQTALSSTQIAVTTAATTCTTESTAEPVQTTIFPALVSPDDINLRNAEGDSSHYLFTYHETDFQAVYKTDHWTIQDSYRITDPADMIMICDALIAAHPIHSADLTGYRTASDMAYEWTQHNLAYQLLGEDAPYKENAKDVDFDPNDQGKSMYEIYLDRTGQDSTASSGSP